MRGKGAGLGFAEGEHGVGLGYHSKEYKGNEAGK